MTRNESSAYIDYESFLDPSFSPTAFSNTLVVATNDAADTPLDLNTPLSRVLFDIQEVDTHIDGITSKSALSLLSYTQDHVAAGSHILQQLEAQLSILQDAYGRLQREVLGRHEAAEEMRMVTDRIWHTVRLGRAVSRCLALARQLDFQMADLRKAPPATRKEDHKGMVRASNTLILLRQALATESENLDRIHIVRHLRTELVDASERLLVARADQYIKQFSMSALEDVSGPMFSTSEDIRTRTTASLLTLYLLSPMTKSGSDQFEPTKLVLALDEYVRRAITASIAGLSVALAALPKLDRAVSEISARCQNIVALELLLDSIKAPAHPPEDDRDELLSSHGSASRNRGENLLQPLLAHLDTTSLPSHFWRTMASQLSPRVQKIVRDGGVCARNLRMNRERVADALRSCVDRGSQIPAGILGKTRLGGAGEWQRESTVMVQALVSVLGR